MNRTQKSFKNLLFGELQQLINIAVSFATRTVMVHTLGVTILGVNSVFTELIALLSLAELGVGRAITFHLYQPLAQNDIPRLKQLMKLFKTAYRMIALAIMAIGLITMPFIQLTVTDTGMDESYLRFIYLLFVFQAAVSYLFSYKAILLTADQKSYKVAWINTLCRVGYAAAAVILLLKTNNFVAYLCVQIACTLAINLLISHSATKEYPFLREHAESLEPEGRREVLSNVKFVFIGALSGKITNSTDNVLISMLDSTTTVGYYSNYQLIISAVRNLLDQIVFASKGSIGNMLTSESDDKCDEVLRRLTYLVFIPTLICSLCLYGTLSLFIGGLWYDASFVLSDLVVFVLVVNFFLVAARNPLLETVSAANLFRIDKNISILGSTINLIVSIVLGLKLGMLGVFIGTTCTHVVQIALKILLLYRRRLHRSATGYYLLFARMLGLFALGMLLIRWFGSVLVVSNVLLALLLRWLAAIVLSCALAMLGFLGTKEQRYLLWFLQRLLSRLKRGGKGGKPIAG
ncbi:MAG: lipopolysaccharide biosynthesis protein [Eubacteriales bacterium]|nr:lipopolysaccharide biosynthesis protein [Eubacteriales bacterium]